MPSLTIIIPTIGRKTLERAIHSVEHQTIETELEVELDINHEGQAVVRNRMIKDCTTKWVGFCDDDDWLDPHYHEWLDEATIGVDMIIFYMQHGNGLIIPGHTDVDRLKYNWVGISFALRTKVAKQFPFESMIGEDFDLIKRVKNAGYRIKIVPKVAYFIGD